MTLPAPPPPAAAPPPAPPGSRRGVLIGALAALLVGVVALALLLPGGVLDDDGPATGTPPAPTAAAPPEPEPAGTDPAAGPVEQPDPAEVQAQRDELFTALVRRDMDDPQAVGDPDAPVVMITWADFRCGYCASYAIDVEPVLLEQYVTTGVLRIEWRDFARVTPESATLAAAARAAGRQGEFWAYHDALFAELGGSARTDDATLRAIAEGLGLDVALFDADRASAEVLTAVQADGEQAAGIGVSGTPTFLVNGAPLVGAQPLEAFQATIEAELARAGG